MSKTANDCVHIPHFRHVKLTLWLGYMRQILFYRGFPVN